MESLVCVQKRFIDLESLESYVKWLYARSAEEMERSVSDFVHESRLWLGCLQTLSEEIGALEVYLATMRRLGDDLAESPLWEEYRKEVI